MVKNNWSDEDTKELEKMWSNSTRDEIQKRFSDRTWVAIRSHANGKGFKQRSVDRVDWNDNDLSILIKHWPSTSKKRVLELFPGRSWPAIKSKAVSLSISRWVPRTPPILADQYYIEKEKFKGKWFEFGIVSDTHYGSKYAQLGWLHRFYEILNKRKIRRVFHAGDISEGNGTHYRGQRHEMHITGADNLKNYVVDNYPRLERGKTLVISGGHDLDLWTGEGYDIVARVCEERKDMEYLGQSSAYYEFGNRLFYIIHPGGGSAYAISYRPQKIVESFSSGNKPHILIIGHYHKADFMPCMRNVVTFQASCFQWQTPFAIQRQLQWHYGGWIVRMLVKEKQEGSDWDGIATVIPEFYPFYVPKKNDYKNYCGPKYI